MNNEQRRTTGIVAGIIFLVISLVVGLVLVQQRQVTQQDAEEIELPDQFIECTWATEGNWLISLEDEGGNTVAGPVTITSGTRHVFEIDPRDLPDPVYCVIEDPNNANLSCKKRDLVEGCEPPPTATTTPIRPGLCEPCEEDEVLPRCAEGYVCVHLDDGSKQCQDPEKPIDQCGPTVTLPPIVQTPTATPTTTPSPTPTTPPGEPTYTPAPTATPEPTTTPEPTVTPEPSPTTCPIPDAVQNIAMSCSETPGRCSWDASDGADYYLVTIKDKNTGAPIDGYNPNLKTTETEVTFEPVSGHNYECIVEAVNETCGGSPATISDACSYNTPTTTPEPTIEPSITPEPSPTDVIIVEISATPAPTLPEAGEPTASEPELPKAGLGRTTIMITAFLAIVGTAALFIGLAM